MNQHMFGSHSSHGESHEALFDWLERQHVDNESINALKLHKIDELTFQMLKKSDLREMGIDKLGAIKRILYLIEKKHFCSPPDSDDSNDYRPPPFCLENGSDSKILKACFSALYCFLSLGVSAYVMVLAHERLPDISKYPPLPDILLDNLPYIPWAFEAAEAISIFLSFIWTVVLAFHRHRLILFRRLCSLVGTVFLLRSVTMIITSLSVPGKHLLTECKPFVFRSSKERFERAVVILFGFGMTLQGVRTCGDYMFSGHTAVITLLNFFITEYTPESFSRLHNLTWLLNGFGVFFILAAHEHYSIDVFIAIYISTRLFLYYHWQANNQYKLGHRDQHRSWIWFPLFTFFECDVRGPIPYEYSNPIKDFLSYWRKKQFRLPGLPLAVSSLGFSSASISDSAPNGSAVPIPVASRSEAVQREKGE